MEHALIRAENATRILSGAIDVTLVRNINLEIARGEMVAINGPSGSGKSSLLYLLGLLDTPTSGRILVDGIDTGTLSDNELADLRLAKVGFVFQFHFLLPEFTVLDNIMVPMLKLARLSSGEVRDRAENLLRDLGLSDHMKKRPEQLSGGQRQRVAIARALANEPAIILADEPTGSLDQKNGQLVFDVFKQLAHEMGKAVITVTHDAHLAAQTDRQIHLVDGQIVYDVNGDRMLPAGAPV
ncbi:MAG: ABC transporter ATP-binding protein [Alphaproteobacteria bacterium]